MEDPAARKGHLAAVLLGVAMALAQGWAPCAGVISSAYRNCTDLSTVLPTHIEGYTAGVIVILVLIALADHLLSRQIMGSESQNRLPLLVLIAYVVQLVGVFLSIAATLSNTSAWSFVFFGCALTLAGDSVVFATCCVYAGRFAPRGQFFWFSIPFACTLWALLALDSWLEYAIWTYAIAAISTTLALIILLYTLYINKYSTSINENAIILSLSLTDTTDGANAHARKSGIQSLLARAFALGLLLGALVSLMVSQFLGATFATPPFLAPFGFAGVAIGSASLLYCAKHKKMRVSVVGIIIAAAFIVAFFPFDPGTQFSFSFACGVTYLATFIVVACLPTLVGTWLASKLGSSDTEPAGEGRDLCAWCLVHVVTGLAFGALAVFPLGFYAARSPIETTLIFASGIVSIVGILALMVDLGGFLHRRPAVDVGVGGDAGRGGVAGGPSSPDPSAGSVAAIDDGIDLRCEEVAGEHGLTPPRA